MKKSYSKSKKNVLALLLSVLMVTSAASVFSACGNDAVDSSSTSSSEEADTSTSVKDNGLIKNANFKTADFNKNDKGQRLNPIVKSVTGWGTVKQDSIGSDKAHSSYSESGILDVSEESWKDLTTYDKEKVEVSEAEAEKNWSTFTTREKLEYYKYWKSDKTSSEKSKIATTLKNFYETFNIDEEDLPLSTLQATKNQPLDNPGTHYAEGEEEDTNVLMIRNQNPSYSTTSKIIGSAQKFVSTSTVTVPAGAAAKFSVWVKTAELQQANAAGTAVNAVDKGAYISIAHSVGNTSLPDFEVKNINTETLNPDGANNGWMQYEFLLEGAAYTDTTFTLTLGLGQGTQYNKAEEVNGYAFFDDIQCEIIETGSQFAADKTVGFDSEETEKTIDAFEHKAWNKFALDFHQEIGGASLLENKFNGDSVKPTTSEYNGKDVTSIAGGENVLPALGTGLNGDQDFNGLTSLNELKGVTDNEYLTSIYNQYLKSEKAQPWLGGDEKIFLMMSSNGVAYTATDALSFSQADFTGTDGEVKDYILISLYAKTSDMSGCTGGGITLTDNKAKTSFSAIDTSKIAPVQIGDDEDVYDGWQQYLFFVENDFEEKENVSFTLSFTFGVTDLSTATKDSFYEGFAAFTNLEIYPMTEKEYEAATTGTYAKKVTVTGVTADEDTGNDGFDSVSNLNKTELEDGTAFARLQNYAGVYSDSYYVNQPVDNISQDDALINFNQYANAGLVNKKYFVEGTEESGKGYYDSVAATGVSHYFTKAAVGTDVDLTDAEAVWNTVVGKRATQPLFIWNDETMTKAYGYLSGNGKGTSIAANTYAAVSLRVKAVNATASIYLVDMDDDTFGSTLSIGSNLVYWYDKDGNICTGENLTTKAFLLQSNGLYKANPKWNGYEKLADKDSYYANLTAYEKDEKGNLIVAEGGASHDYTKEDENGNVIAFYYIEGAYYTDANKTTKVLNLFDVTKTNNETDETHPLPYRYLANTDKELTATVTNTDPTVDDGWVTVTFYIHTGNKAKNYRLEVWSGTREGTVNKSTTDKPSYVLFDINNPGDAESNFTNLLEESEDLVDDANKFESIFSYYDSSSFLRYDKALDTEKVGNLYKDSYDPTAQTEGIAYLYLEESGRKTYFVDYSYSEVEVAAQAESEDDADDSSSEDTTTGDETNVWLLAGSLIIAAALLFAIASIIVRKALKNRRKANRSAKK